MVLRRGSFYQNKRGNLVMVTNHFLRATIEQFDTSMLTLEINFAITVEDGDIEDIEFLDFDIISGAHTDFRSLEELAEEYFDSEAGQAAAVNVYYGDNERSYAA